MTDQTRRDVQRLRAAFIDDAPTANTVRAFLSSYDTLGQPDTPYIRLYLQTLIGALDGPAPAPAAALQPVTPPGPAFAMLLQHTRRARRAAGAR